MVAAWQDASYQDLLLIKIIFQYLVSNTVNLLLYLLLV
jgi:hypothetical protein